VTDDFLETEFFRRAAHGAASPSDFERLFFGFSQPCPAAWMRTFEPARLVDGLGVRKNPPAPPFSSLRPPVCRCCHRPGHHQKPPGRFWAAPSAFGRSTFSPDLPGMRRSVSTTSNACGLDEVLKRLVGPGSPRWSHRSFLFPARAWGCLGVPFRGCGFSSSSTMRTVGHHAGHFTGAGQQQRSSPAGGAHYFGRSWP